MDPDPTGDFYKTYKIFTDFYEKFPFVSYISFVMEETSSKKMRILAKSKKSRKITVCFCFKAAGSGSINDIRSGCRRANSIRIQLDPDPDPQHWLSGIKHLDGGERVIGDQEKNAFTYT